MRDPSKKAPPAHWNDKEEVEELDELDTIQSFENARHGVKDKEDEAFDSTRDPKEIWDEDDEESEE